MFVFLICFHNQCQHFLFAAYEFSSPGFRQFDKNNYMLIHLKPIFGSFNIIGKYWGRVKFMTYKEKDLITNCLTIKLTVVYGGMSLSVNGRVCAEAGQKTFQRGFLK